MSAYTGDASSMTEVELKDAMKDLASIWRKDPWKSNDQTECARLGELEDALETRFKVKQTIGAVPKGSTNYQVVPK